MVAYKNKILIVVPTLNSYILLPKLVDSLKTQTNGNWEVLFVDGNSSKKHRDWLAKLCKEDIRFNWIKQNIYQKGIYGAMNQGFKLSEKFDWFLFWGSDDWVQNDYVFERIHKIIYNSLNNELDLLIFKGNYINSFGKIVRTTIFRKIFSLNFSLFCGLTPPHQATLISKSCLDIAREYNHNFSIAGDLDFFLNLSLFKNLKIKFFNLNIINMSQGGLSQKKHSLKFTEIVKAYRNVFGNFFWIPIINRYIMRLISLKF